MSIPNGQQDSDTNGRVKTLGIRFEPDIHADMTLIASLRGSSFQAEVLEACRAHVATVKASPELASKADDALAEIEREAAARKDAFARLFGTAPDVTTEPALPLIPETADPDSTEALATEAPTTAADAPAPTTSRKSRSSSTGGNGGGRSS